MDGDGDMDAIIGNSAMNGSATRLMLNNAIANINENNKIVKTIIIDIAPNPASNNINITINNVRKGIYDFYLMNQNMQKVKEIIKQKNIINGLQTEIIVDSLPGGVYYGVLYQNNKQLAVKKIVINK